MSSILESNRWDSMLPLPIRLRHERARLPKPVMYRSGFHDVMGVSQKKELILRDERAVQQDIRIEDLRGQLVRFNGKKWRIVSLDVVAGLRPSLPSDATLIVADLDQPSHTITIPSSGMARIRVMLAPRGDIFRLGCVKHGIMRMIPVVSRREIRVPLQNGQCFEARLRHRELEGLHSIKMSNNQDGTQQLLAARIDRFGENSWKAIDPYDIAPRYLTIPSLDFGACFDVDTFTFREDQIRSRAVCTGSSSSGDVIQDPLLGSLRADSEASSPVLTSGAQHLAVFEKFIRHRIVSPSPNTSGNRGRSQGPDGSTNPRCMTIFNLSMSNQGNAQCVLDALVDFRRGNPTAEMTIVVAKLGPTYFQESVDFKEFMAILSRNNIRLDTFTGASGCSTRQVMHGKGVVIDDEVLFSTAAIMDTWPVNKSDFSVELPYPAAKLFRRFVDEAIHGDAAHGRRADLAAELARLGVLINEPVIGLTYNTRAQDALIRGARQNITISMSELVDPAVTRLLIQRASAGVQVMIQVRELDSHSADLLRNAMAHLPNIRLQDTTLWEPRPHFNAIVADGAAAYVGSSYLWSTQRNMIHQGRSFENGVLLTGQSAANVLATIESIQLTVYRDNPIAVACSLYRSWLTQHAFYMHEVTRFLHHLINEIGFEFHVRENFTTSSSSKHRRTLIRRISRTKFSIYVGVRPKANIAPLTTTKWVWPKFETGIFSAEQVYQKFSSLLFPVTTQ